MLSRIAALPGLVALAADHPDFAAVFGRITAERAKRRFGCDEHACGSFAFQATAQDVRTLRVHPREIHRLVVKRKVRGDHDAPCSHLSFVRADMTDALFLFYLKRARLFKDAAIIARHLFDESEQILSWMKARLVRKANRALDLEWQGRRLCIRSGKNKLCRGLNVSRDALQLIFAFRINVSIRARKIAINSVLFNERSDLFNGGLL